MTWISGTILFATVSTSPSQWRRLPTATGTAKLVDLYDGAHDFEDQMILGQKLWVFNMEEAVFSTTFRLCERGLGGVAGSTAGGHVVSER